MKILVYGSREFGKVVKQLVLDCGHEFMGFIDDFSESPEIIGPYASASVRGRLSTAHAVVNAVGYRDLYARRRITKKIISDGYSMPNLIHPKAYVASGVTLSYGIIIMNSAVVDTNTILDDTVVVWPAAVVNHDCVVRSNTFLSPNATICGGSTVGSNCFVGAGAVVVDHTDVPENTFIKANSIFK